MVRFFLVSATGRVAVLVTGITIALPYIVRSTLLNAAAQSSTRSSPTRLSNSRLLSLRIQLWPHYWLGYALVALVLVHASFVMGPAMGRSDATGIWAATLALCLLFLQVLLGLMLKNRTSNQRQVRRWHFWSMIGFTALVLTHLARNG
jgi:hypothetical protein